MTTLLGWSSQGWPIGRVGNSVYDPNLGFKTETRKVFTEEHQSKDGSLHLFSGSIVSGLPTMDRLSFYPLLTNFAELRDLDRLSARQWKENKGGEKIDHQDPCVDAYYFQNRDNEFLVIQWGVNKGLVVDGIRKSPINQDVIKAITDLVLLEGACQWN